MGDPFWVSPCFFGAMALPLPRGDMGYGKAQGRARGHLELPASLLGTWSWIPAGPGLLSPKIWVYLGLFLKLFLFF